MCKPQDRELFSGDAVAEQPTSARSRHLKLLNCNRVLDMPATIARTLSIAATCLTWACHVHAASNSNAEEPVHDSEAWLERIVQLAHSNPPSLEVLQEMFDVRFSDVTNPNFQWKHFHGAGGEPFDTPRAVFYLTGLPGRRLDIGFHVNPKLLSPITCVKRDSVASKFEGNWRREVVSEGPQPHRPDLYVERFHKELLGYNRIVSLGPPMPFQSACLTRIGIAYKLID